MHSGKGGFCMGEEKLKAGTTAYKNQWQKKNKERINIIANKGYRDSVRSFAKTKGKSLNAFILDAIEEKIQREKPD